MYNSQVLFDDEHERYLVLDIGYNILLCFDLPRLNQELAIRVPELFN